MNRHEWSLDVRYRMDEVHSLVSEAISLVEGMEIPEASESVQRQIWGTSGQVMKELSVTRDKFAVSKRKILIKDDLKHKDPDPVKTAAAVAALWKPAAQPAVAQPAVAQPAPAKGE